MKPSDVISYMDMCQAEGVSLQRGMNFRTKRSYSVILMSTRKGAPYADRIEDNGSVLIYEGHDVPRSAKVKFPKSINQQAALPSGKQTQNGLFYDAARGAKSGRIKPEIVRVYEKIKDGIWTFNGVFELVDSWTEKIKSRQVFKFRLRILNGDVVNSDGELSTTLEHSRLIPSAVKLEVWKRDKGQCVKCGSSANLHFDHDLPFSKGGTSLISANIRLLCAKHNLQKSDKIE